MKTKILIAAILASSCLTSSAWFAKLITPEKVNRIRPGQTTEAELVWLFGPPDSRFSDLDHIASLDWFRAVPPPSSYLPLIDVFVGGLNVRTKELNVVLGPSGRVLRYQYYDSNSAVRTLTQRRTSVRETKYSK